MSSKAKASAALAKGRESRKQGFKSSMHTPELAEFKEWFDQQWSKGDKRVAALIKEGKEQFPKLAIPTAPTLRNYIKKYYVPPTIVLTGYSPDYLKTIETFDSYLKLIAAAEEAWANYLVCKGKDQKVISSKGSDAYQWLQLFIDTSKSIVEVEVKLRIREGVTPVGNVNLTQNNVSLTSNNVLISDDNVSDMMEILKDRNRIDEWKSNVAKLAAERNAEPDAPNQSS